MAKPIFPQQDFDAELVAGNVKNAMKAADAKAGDVYMVPLDKIMLLDGFNVRVKGTDSYNEYIQELATSIHLEGFYRDKPLSGYVDHAGDICITDGHCRVEAASLANVQGATIEALPVIIKPQGTTKEDLTVALVRSNTGRPLAPYELGVVVKRLTGYGLEKAVIAQRLSLTERYIDDLLLLVGAPAAVRNMVITDKVSATTAVKQLRAHGAEAADKLKGALDKAKEGGKKKVTGKHLEKTQPKKKKKVKTEKAPPAEFAEVSPLTGTLDALEVLEAYHAKTPALVDEIMADVVRTAGQDALVAFAIEIERYEATGLVRMGLVELQEDPPAPEPEKAASGKNGGKKGKGGGKKETVQEPGAEAPKVGKELDAAAADL